MKLLNLIAVPLVSAMVVRTQEQVPIVDDSKERIGIHPLREAREESAPIVGIHFTTSYAIASARYHNGTMRDLSKIAGDAQYTDTMSRWANGENDISRDCKDIESPQCRRSTAERSQRRQAGLPISHDAEILSVFMTKVHAVIEKDMGGPINVTAPAFPWLSPKLWDDLKSAIAHSGLLSTRRHGAIPVYREANAAYAARGYGLCEPSTNCISCTETLHSKKAETVLYLNFDNSSMSVGAMRAGSAFDDRATFSYGTDAKLGWWNLPVFEVPRAKFWAQIHEMIMAVVQPMARPPNKIILFGEHGADDEFKEVAKAAVWEVLEFDVDMMMGAVPKEDVAYLVARGAAEMGFRDEELMRQGLALRRDE
ncbi:hypothetical protein CC86DRAFT_338035 [Ophiobolus disseminans]|uniref:Uncharacterized protein n=1 Tax=Ophiobolus disseminans TaxID=1469910 RepID=A0A6A7AI49_9PLEO|nr:hypothetical protein CC86DRAFT_338035 [Ophiobolus disseminans]